MTEQTKKVEAEEISFLSRDAILAADDLGKREVFVKPWNGKVYVKTMTAKEKDAWEETMVVTNEAGDREQNLENFRCKLVAATMCNAKGNLIFPNVQDIKLLEKKSSTAISIVFDAACEMNGIRDKDVEELTKK